MTDGHIGIDGLEGLRQMTDSNEGIALLPKRQRLLQTETDRKIVSENIVSISSTFYIHVYCNFLTLKGKYTRKISREVEGLRIN